MTTNATGSMPHSQWRNCQCPLNDKQDGVCGCPHFWERKVSQTPVQPDTSTAAKQVLTQLRSPSTTPPAPPRETCFFWYHGTCRRGDQCTLAHESHTTWPITPPPGYVHYEPCDLPLCPLRQDLVMFKQGQKRYKPCDQLGGQIDGSALGFLGRSLPAEGRSNDDDSITVDIVKYNEDGIEIDEPEASIIDPSSRALNGLYSDSSDSGNDDGGEEAAMKVNAEPQQDITESQVTNSTTFSPAPAIENMKYFDLSIFTPPPALPDGDETPLLSLSHTGTLGKRGRTTSPAEQESLCNKRRKRHPKTFESLPARELDLKQCSPLVPKGPRALGGGALVCFYWYHKGHCTPKRRRNGLPMKCTYAHTLDMPVTKVSLPPNIGNHPSCSLRLCPLRAAEGLQDITKQGTKESMETFTKDDPVTPPRHGTAIHDASSSPRDCIAQARAYVKAPKHMQLPKLTGSNRLRFKAQKRAVENWQADKGVTLLKTGRQLHEEKKMRRQHKRDKRMEKREAESPVLNYGDAAPTMDTVLPGAIATPAQITMDWQPHRQKMQADNDGAMNQDNIRPRVLIDYELPMGDDRLDWDTDRVRRLFGESE